VLQQELVWVQVELEQLVVQVQLFVVEVVAHFKIVGAASATLCCGGDSSILDYICWLTNHGGFVVVVGAYSC